MSVRLSANWLKYRGGNPMSKKKKDEAAEAVEETAEKAEEIVAETDNDLEADEYGEDIDYEEVEDILAIDEAEKKRTLRRICAFVGAGIAAIGIIAAVYTFFFRKKD